MVNISVKNKGIKPWLFNYWKKYIYDAVKHFTELFDLKTTINILVKKNYNHSISTKTEIAAIAQHKRNNIYNIIIYDHTLYKAINKKILNLDPILFHEVCHIFDMIQLANNPFYNIDVNSTKQKTIKDFTISVGFDFWTEIFAYYTTSEVIEKQSGLSYNEISKGYDEIIKTKKSLPILYPEDYLTAKSIYDYMNLVEDLPFHLSAHIANHIKTSPKTETSLNQIYNKLHKLCSKMIKEPYCKKTIDNLHCLGKTLIEEYYKPLNINVCKNKNYYYLAYMFKDKN